MEPNLPVLAILPLHSLIIHEHHDDSRTGPLIDRMQKSVVFTNPIIVMPLHDHTARYMVLDGANRTTATRQMGFEHILAQVVEQDALGVETQTWNHIVWDIEPAVFLENIARIEGLVLAASNPEQAYECVIYKQGLAAVHLPDGRVFEIHVQNTNGLIRNEFLNRIVDTYKDTGRFDRTNQRTIGKWANVYQTLSGLVFMPKLSIRHLTNLVSQGHVLPAGVTRFTISPRALRVNFPMDILLSDLSLEEKNDALYEFINRRIKSKGVRYYAEETVLYDE